MRRHLKWLLPACVLLIAAGCGNPLKRPSANVFPGSEEYAKRVQELKITPNEAYQIAHEAARAENKLQFVSRRPTVIVKRTYVFSMPMPSGANLRGYHVDGDTGKVKFVEENRTIEHSKR